MYLLGYILAHNKIYLADKEVDLFRNHQGIVLIHLGRRLETTCLRNHHRSRLPALSLDALDIALSTAE
jgi:hypothetical protein